MGNALGSRVYTWVIYYFKMQRSNYCKSQDNSYIWWDGNVVAGMGHRRCLEVKFSQSCLTLYPVDYTVHGILQARILE